MDIVLTGRDGQWSIEDGYVDLRLKFIGADGQPFAQKWHGFPATPEGFEGYQNQLQTRLANTVYASREEEEPVASACRDRADHLREMVGIVADIRRQWEAASQTEQGQRDLRHFAFGDIPRGQAWSYHDYVASGAVTPQPLGRELKIGQ